MTWYAQTSALRARQVTGDALARAAAGAPLAEPARLGPEPVTRWRAGDAEAGRALADLELRRLGLGPA